MNEMILAGQLHERTGSHSALAEFVDLYSGRLSAAGELLHDAIGRLKVNDDEVSHHALNQTRALADYIDRLTVDLAEVGGFWVGAAEPSSA